MKTLALLGLLASASFAAIDPVQVPYILDSAETPQVTYVDQNDAALQNKINQVVDSVNLYAGGGLKASSLKSTSSLNVTIDSDNNQTNQKFSITNNGQTDTLFKVDETLRRTRVFGKLLVDSGATFGGSLDVSGGATFTSRVLLDGQTIYGVDTLNFGAAAGYIAGDFSSGGSLNYNAITHYFTGLFALTGGVSIDLDGDGPMEITGGGVNLNDSLDVDVIKTQNVNRAVLISGDSPPDEVTIGDGHHILMTNFDTTNYTLPSAVSNPGRELVFRVYGDAVATISNPSGMELDITVSPGGAIELPYYTNTGVGGSVTWKGITFVSDGFKWTAVSVVVSEYTP